MSVPSPPSRVGSKGIFKRAGQAALVCGQATEILPLINSRAAAQQGVGESWAAVVLQRAEQRIGVDLVCGIGQKAAAIIAAQVVAKRGDSAGKVGEVLFGSAGVQDRVADLRHCSAERAFVVDTATAIRRVAT